VVMREDSQFHIRSPETPLPLEYRYSTRYQCRVAGGIALTAAGTLAGGVWGLAVGILGVLLTLTGLPGFFADPRAFVHTPGHRLVVTDDCIEEIDERGRVCWRFLPAELLAVRVVRRTTGRTGRGQRETWLVELRERPRVKIPVWLLPGEGSRFRARFENLIRYARVSCRWLNEQA